MPATVLVVDDDRDLVRLLGRFLTMEGFTAIPASNGREALDYLRAGNSVDVILLDLRMPVMDGWTFRREQRADPAIATIPVIVLSGIVDLGGMEDLGVAAAFNKPVGLPELVNAVRQLAEARS